jgi:hypothetical protein
MARQVNFNGYLLRQFGAYIRTDLSALVEVSGVASGIIGITGLAERGPTNTPVTITSYIQLVNVFGDGPLVRHGLAAYVGGANTIIAVRLNDSESAFAAQTAELNVVVNSTDGYSFRAREAGTYGNGVSVRVSTPVVAGTLVASSDTVISDDIQYFNTPIPEDVALLNEFTPGSYYIVENWNVRFGQEGYDPSSYALFRWNGDRWGVAQTRDVNSLVTTRVGSVEETLQVPYFIDEVPWVRALALGTPEVDGRYYYVLLNIENNQIRPIPENWLAGELGEGIISFENFERVVNNLKGDDEIIFNGSVPSEFELSLNAPTQFPFQLVQHIMNFGGFGSGPSSVVTVDVQDSEVVNPPLVSQGFTFLQGGYNGEDGTGWSSTAESEAGNFTSSPSYPTTAWDVALGVFENEEVNFIQPAYLFGSLSSFEAKYSYFKSIAQKFINHVNLMSNTPNRKFRTTVLGIPSGQDGATSLNATQYLARTQDVTGVVNSDRVQLWAGGFFSNRFSGPTQRNVLYGSEWLASFVSGAHASRDVSVSLTFSQISQIITGGTEYLWTSSQKDELYGRSLAFAMKRRTSAGAIEYVAAHNYTSFTGAPSRGIQLFVTRRIVDFMNSFIYKNLEENFIGRKSRGASTAAEIRISVDGLLRQLLARDMLVAYERISVVPDTTDNTTYYIEFRFQPVTEINFILTSNKLVYNIT